MPSFHDIFLPLVNSLQCNFCWLCVNPFCGLLFNQFPIVCTYSLNKYFIECMLYVRYHSRKWILVLNRIHTRYLNYFWFLGGGGILFCWFYGIRMTSPKIHQCTIGPLFGDLGIHLFLHVYILFTFLSYSLITLQGKLHTKVFTNVFY